MWQKIQWIIKQKHQPKSELNNHFVEKHSEGNNFFEAEHHIKPEITSPSKIRMAATKKSDLSFNRG